MKAKYKIAPSKAVVGVDRPCMHYHIALAFNPFKITNGNTLIELAPSLYFFIKVFVCKCLDGLM